MEAESGRIGMRQSGASVIFDGWGAVWPLEMKDDVLDPAVEGEDLELLDIQKEQRFTKPPARYTDSGLVKALEDDGIGRPSTYASIVQTLYDRRYVNRNEEKRLEPTPLGRIVDKFLEAHFPGIVDKAFTAGMESELDGIEENGRPWKDVVQEFWDGFSMALSEAEIKAEKVPPPPPEFIGEDPVCLCRLCAPAKGADQCRLAPAGDKVAQHVHHAVDQSPGRVAADGCQQHGPHVFTTG